MAPAIDIEGLTKDYKVGFWRPRPYRALDGLTLQVTPGEVYAITVTIARKVTRVCRVRCSMPRLVTSLLPWSRASA